MAVLGLGWPELDALGSILGGLFTAGATVTALVVLKREINTRRAENRERLRLQEDEARRQARLVYATLDPERPIPSGHVPRRRGDPGPSPTEVYVRVFNESDEPVWDVKVPIAGREHRPLLIERVGPHGSAGNGWLDAPDDWHLMNVGPGCPGTPHWLPLDVVFVDNSGRRWRRSGRGEPVRLLDSEDLR